MTGTRRHRRGLALVIVLFSLLLPVHAEAHLPTIGLGPVYDGIFHLFLSPEDLIPVVALALLAGQRGPTFARRVLWIVPIAWFTGGMIGMFVGASPWPSMTFVSFLVLGGLIASNAKISLPLLTAVASTIGVFHGYLNGTGLNRFIDGAHALVGLALAVCVVIAIFTSFVIPQRRQWALIVIRVAGSWIAASGLLMLGWALRPRS